MKTKYIQIRHLDYFDSLYELMGNKVTDLTGVEFLITDKKNGEEEYFWMDFYNLTALNEGDLKDESNSHCLCKKLNSGEIDFFIQSAYFPTAKVFYEPKDFLAKTIFEQKNPTVPHYVHICLNETEPLTPQNIIKWLKKLSLTLFGEQFDFDMGEVELKEEAVIRCKEEFKEQGKPYYLTPSPNNFLTYKSLGWSEFKLGEFIGEPSGVTNFILDIADGLIKAMNGKTPISIGFDEEGTEFTLLFDIYDRVLIISYDDDTSKLYKCKITPKELANIFLTDMKRDFSKYIEDEDFFDYNEKNQQKYSQVLLEKLKVIENLLGKEYDKKYFANLNL